MHRDISQALLDSNVPVPVILGGHVNGLAIARSFGFYGLASIVVDAVENLAFYSRYTSGLVTADPADDEGAFIEALLALGRRLSRPGVLFATRDNWLIAVCKHRDKLEPYFHFPMSPWPVLERCIDKIRLNEAALDAGIPCPLTFTLPDISRLPDVVDRIKYPCILKPSITVGFMEALGTTGRTLVLDSKDHLLQAASRIVESGLANVPLVVQESIPGGAEHLFTLTAYSNPKGKIVSYSIGHKIRQFPPEAGTITAGRVVPTPRLFELGQRLIESVQFYGISNTEFKYDARDREYKLIEINPRPGMWNYSALSSGVNLPLLAYKEVLGEAQEFAGTSQETLVWVHTIDDFRKAVITNRRSHKAHAITVWQWIRSIRGRKVDAVFSRRDPLPFIMELWRSFRGLLRKYGRRK